MRICKVAIKNWRSVKDLEFCPQDITALIGPNNAGKTNILSALSFLLGERWPSGNSLQDTDFYQKDRSRELCVSAWFEDAPEGINRIWFSSTSGRLQYSYRGNDKPYSLTQARRELFPVVYLDAARSYEGTFSTSQWSLFGRIIRELDKFFRDSNSVDEQAKVEALLSEAQKLLKTDLYNAFEQSITKSFADQVRLTSHRVRFDFRTFDPLNFYKTLHPVLIEQEIAKSPSELGSGMRNLIVLALFRAYASVLKGGAIIAIEEPEIYLHPHAQRSLASLFEDMAKAGNQIFYSTHSSNFVSVVRADRIVLVERCLDDEEETCTQAHSTDGDILLHLRKTLHPRQSMTLASVQEKYSLICEPIHADAFFARVVVIVEGPTEAAAIPIFAKFLDLDINALGISIVPARGKTNIDLFFHLYQAHGLHVFAIFDNDMHKKSSDNDRAWNRVLTRMLGLEESVDPVACTGRNYAILNGDYEQAMREDLEKQDEGLYEDLYNKAVSNLGTSKPLIARYMAAELVKSDIVPDFISEIIEAIRVLADPTVLDDEIFS